MLRNRELYDPIQRSGEMPIMAFRKYTELNEDQPGPTDPALINHIQEVFFNSHPNIEKRLLDWNWENILPMLETNVGLATFIIDFHGAESNFFFPWLIAVKRKLQAEALEMSYGCGRDLEGQWIENILETNDPIVRFVRDDPTFVYNRERQLRIADIATTVKNNRRLNEKTKVIDFGAGRLTWVRKHGYDVFLAAQSILAFDADSTIEPDLLFPVKPSAYGITYRKDNFMNELRSPDCNNADLIILGGVASYYPIDAFAEMIIKPIHDLLKPGGVFFFDLQVDCLYYKRSVSIFNWPKMNLAICASGAIQKVEDIRKLLWREGLQFSAEYMLDTYNEYPTSVMVTFTRVTTNNPPVTEPV